MVRAPHRCSAVSCIQLTISRCIPLASIITPSTLTVQNVLRVPAATSTLEAPNLEFASFDFLAPMIYNGSEKYWQYFGINDAVKRIATTTMVGGEILPISAPGGHANASWTVNFYGPSLTCGSATQEDERAIWYNVLDSIKPTRTDPPYWPCYELNAYASWSNNPDTWLPYDDDDDELILQATSYGTAQRMFVASTPWSGQQFQRLCGFGEESNIIRDLYQKPDSATDPFLPELFDTASMVECRAVNASYTIQFEYINGQQNLNIAIDRSGEPLVPIYNVTGPSALSPNSSTHLDGEASDPDCSTWNSQGDRCRFDVTTLRTIAYQAVVDAFSTVLHGTLTTSNPAIQHLMFFNSDVAKTRLVDTDELSWVPGYFHYLTPDTVNLTAQMELQAGTEYVGLSNTKSNKIQGSLATAIEDLFTNYTISLMSDPYLLYVPSPLTIQSPADLDQPDPTTPLPSPLNDSTTSRFKAITTSTTTILRPCG